VDVKEDAQRRDLVLWVAREVMPHEPAVRAWLARSVVAPEDADDIIQDAYCRISALDSVAYIESPRAFFFQIVRNLLLNQIKRSRIVRIDAALDAEHIEHSPSPETVAGDKREWSRVQRLLAALPERCRTVLELRKIDGIAQKDIAARLGISENVVENESSRGLRQILQGLREQGNAIADEYQARRQRGARR
jgi:RNA polymerase sigma-70 factor (ECF subfamily)